MKEIFEFYNEIKLMEKTIRDENKPDKIHNKNLFSW